MQTPGQGGTDRAIRAHRNRPVMWGIVAVGAVAALVTGLFFMKSTAAGKTQPGTAAKDAARTACVPQAPTSGGCPQPSRQVTSAAPTPPPHATTPAGRHRAGAVTHPARPAAPASPDPVTSPTAPAGGSQGAAAQQVLALINRARAQAGLPAYTVTSGLRRSAAAHNARMAGGCGLSHQCPGEPSLGARETAAGVNWTAAGENIGEGGPVSGGGAAVAQMAIVLTKDMLSEKPPADGHRQNILSSSLRHIGIVVLRDSSGTVWMTQDFSN